jgi:hypothetical protein
VPESQSDHLVTLRFILGAGVLIPLCQSFSTRTCTSPTLTEPVDGTRTTWVPLTGAPAEMPVQLTCQTLVAVIGQRPVPLVRSGSERWV